MSGLLDHLLNLDPIWLISVAALLVFLEDAIFIGFVIPGETAAVLAGVGSNVQHVTLVVPVLAIVIAAIAGDSVGYEVGRKWFAPMVNTNKILIKHRVRIERAQAFLQLRGGVAVFLGRFTAFFRAMMPALAGAARMPYRRFLIWNAAGGIVWGSAFVSIGYLAGASYKKVESQAGRGAAYTLAGVVVVALIVWKIRSERKPKSPKTDSP